MDEFDEEEMEQELHEFSQEIGQKVLELTEKVHPLRIALAGAILLLILGALASTWYWAIPRDDVEIEVTYLQRNGHIVLAELFNEGSRSITDVVFIVEFADKDGIVIGNISENFDAIPSHTSISGERMQINVQGYTVWEEYSIQIHIEWTDFSILSKERKYTLHFGREKLTEINQLKSQVEPGDIFAQFSDHEKLVIGIYQGNGAQLLGLSFDSPITIIFEEG